MEYSLTTGQMLDSLEVGRIAESKNKRHVIKSPRFEHNESILPCDSTGSIIKSEPLYLNKQFYSQKWRILPKFVSFEEAIKAYKDGRIIESFLGDSEEPWAGYSKKASIDQSISLEEIVNGKWRIQGGSE